MSLLCLHEHHCFDFESLLFDLDLDLDLDLDDLLFEDLLRPRFMMSDTVLISSITILPTNLSARVVISSSTSSASSSSSSVVFSSTSRGRKSLAAETSVNDVEPSLSSFSLFR